MDSTASENRLCVLLVDDDRGNRYALARILESFGMKVTTAATSREARELVKPEHRFILLDWIMQDGDSSLLLADMRAAAPASRVAIITVAIDRKHEISRHNPDAILTKPLDLAQLRRWLTDGGAQLAPDSV